MARDDAAMRQQAAADRRLRDQIRAVAERADAERDDLVDLSSNKLEQELNTLNALQAQIQRPREQAEDADAFCLISQRGLESARLLAAGGKFRTPRALAARIKAAFGVVAPAADSGGARGGGSGGGRGGRARADDAVEIDWAPLSRFSSSLFRFAPGLSCALGPLDAPRRSLRSREAPRRRETPPPAAAPTVRGGGREGGGGCEEGEDDGPAQETDRRMEAMLAELVSAARRAERQKVGSDGDHHRSDGSVRAIEAVLDHGSFATTVENLFALSFLIRDGHVAMRDSPRGYLVTAVKRGKAGAAAAAAPTAAGATATSPSGRGVTEHRHQHQHRQLVLAYSTADYEEWKRAVDPGSCLMPKHQESLKRKGGGGGGSGGFGGGSGGVGGGGSGAVVGSGCDRNENGGASGERRGDPGDRAPCPPHPSSPAPPLPPTAPRQAAAVAAPATATSNGFDGGGASSSRSKCQSRRSRSPPPARASKRNKR